MLTGLMTFLFRISALQPSWIASVTHTSQHWNRIIGQSPMGGWAIRDSCIGFKLVWNISAGIKRSVIAISGQFWETIIDYNCRSCTYWFSTIPLYYEASTSGSCFDYSTNDLLPIETNQALLDVIEMKQNTNHIFKERSLNGKWDALKDGLLSHVWDAIMLFDSAWWGVIAWVLWI